MATLYEIKLIFVTETWFSETSIIEIPSFTICFHADRAGGGGGGVAIYVHEDLELVTSWLYLCIYRPPLNYSSSGDIDPIASSRRISEAVDKHIAAATAINSALVAAKRAVENKLFNGMIVLDDFNYPGIKWHIDGSARVQASKSRLSSLGFVFWETTNELSLVQRLTEPTFVAVRSETANTLDLLLTDVPVLINEIEMGPPLGTKTQGHMTVQFDLTVSCIRKKSFDSRNLDYSRGNYEKLSTIISRVDLRSILCNIQIDDAYREFLNRYEKACHECIPPKIHRAASLPWFSRQIERLTKRKRNLWHANSRTKWLSSTLANKYTRARNDLSKQTRRAIRSHELKLAGDKRNPKKLFAYVNSKQSTREAINAITDRDGVTHTDGTRIANAINQQFSSVFTRHGARLPFFSRRPYSSSIEHFKFDTGVISERLNKLNRHKSRGADGVSPYVLRECSTAFAFIRCLQDHGNVRTRWPGSSSTREPIDLPATTRFRSA